MTGRRPLHFLLLLFPVLLVAAFVSAGLQAAPDEARAAAAAFLARIADPVFDAAEVDPEKRLTIDVVADDDIRAVVVKKSRAIVSDSLLRLVERPEEAAAIIAHLVAAAEIDGPNRVFPSGFRVETRPPSKSAYSGMSSSVDERLAERSQAAALDTVKRAGAFGPSEEEIRAHAQRIDAYTIEILRRLGLSSAPLQALYERMADAGAGLLERDDFLGRKILAEQIRWLRERTEPVPGRTEFWLQFDDDLKAVKTALGAS
ncbi:MAG: hypothetical protein ACE5ED_07290 [Rhodothalassiaceae bacterium]